MTGEIAPHEGREIELVLGGVKPIATVEHDKAPETYVKAILLGLAGMLHYRVQPTEDCERGEVVFCLPSNRNNLVEYDWLRKEGVQNVGLKAYHRAMGRLFGYSPADIEAYIESDIHCECSKCRG